MNFLDLKDIAEREMELVNPTSVEKIIAIGTVAGLKPGDRVIDFGCGYAEALVLWAENFGITGIGIDIRTLAVERARDKIASRGLTGQIEVHQGKGADYKFSPNSFDLAACIGASFIWGSFKPALQALKLAIRPLGKVIIGEPYWQSDAVPPQFAQVQVDVHNELQLLQIARQEELDVEYVIRASPDDWDRYEAGNWHGLLHWIQANPDHPDRQQVIDHLHESQEEYFTFGRQNFGWALFLLNPVSY